MCMLEGDKGYPKNAHQHIGFWECCGRGEGKEEEVWMGVFHGVNRVNLFEKVISGQRLGGSE